MRQREIPRAADRLAVLEKIAEYERTGRFDVDVEDDPESRVLLPDEIEYLNKGVWGAVQRKAAFLAAYAFFGIAQMKKQIILHKPVGVEHLTQVEGGAIITCNHFNPLDSFVMQRVFDASHHKKRMYRIIREGNYTSFGGFYGFLMRHCNTLPLSSNMETMKKLLRAVSTALEEGNCILIYPEQSMWWNYRKPKPLKSGAFDMAVKNRVPVVPCFITLKDSKYIGADGFPVQEYTPHIGKPIYPDETLGRFAAREKLRDENYAFFKETYEAFYGIPLTYTTEQAPRQ